MGMGMEGDRYEDGTGRAPNCCNGSMWAELVLGWKGWSSREVSSWAGVGVCYKQLDLEDHSSKHRLRSQGLWGGAGTYSQTWVPHSPEGVNPDTTGRRGDL